MPEFKARDRVLYKERYSYDNSRKRATVVRVGCISDHGDVLIKFNDGTTKAVYSGDGCLSHIKVKEDNNGNISYTFGNGKAVTCRIK